jgi:hypothetical protein
MLSSPGYSAVWSVFELKCQHHLQGPKSAEHETSVQHVHSWFHVRLITDTEDGSDTFLRNCGSHTEYSELQKMTKCLTSSGQACLLVHLNQRITEMTEGGNTVTFPMYSRYEYTQQELLQSWSGSSLSHGRRCRCSGNITRNSVSLIYYARTNGVEAFLSPLPLSTFMLQVS